MILILSGRISAYAQILHLAQAGRELKAPAVPSPSAQQDQELPSPKAWEIAKLQRRIKELELDLKLAEDRVRFFESTQSVRFTARRLSLFN